MESPNSELLWPPPNVTGEGASHNARGGRAPLPLHRYGLASSLSNCGSMEEEDYVRVLHAIDEFLPVKELAGRLVDVSVLKEFGLIDNEAVDGLLATAFGRVKERLEMQRTAAKQEPLKQPSR